MYIEPQHHRRSPNTGLAPVGEIGGARPCDNGGQSDGCPAPESWTNDGGSPMAKRGRKKRDRKHSKANHGKRPNS
ncbi:hypothetical protein B5M45_09620 [Mycobacterium simiae]|nr:hypothetical protein B5M45_09620 [Mycobacterium simiae]